MIKERVCIVGLGLMGGSLALALRPYLEHLTVVDNDPKTMHAAEDLADRVSDDLAKVAHDVDIIILCTPVRTIVSLLATLPALRPDGCKVIDLGSTKSEICRQMEALPAGFEAIGGHPMCGKETSGLEAATANLFRFQTFVLCPNDRTSTAVQALAFEIVTTIGARPLYLKPDEHDWLVAAASHLPYMVAALLMKSVAEVADDRLWTVSASGFRDTVRLAGSDPQMMLDIVLTNKAAVSEQLERYREQLDHLVGLLESGYDERLFAWLEATQQQHVQYRNRKL